MTTKERLHQLVDTLPEAEARIIERMLQGLQARAEEPEAAPVLYTLDDAPPDDEPDDDDADGGLTEAREQMARGEVYTMEEVKHERAELGPALSALLHHADPDVLPAAAEKPHGHAGGPRLTEPRAARAVLSERESGW